LPPIAARYSNYNSGIQGKKYLNRKYLFILGSPADNAKARELFWKPLSWLGTIRPTSANDAFDPALWETFISTTLGLEVPTLAALPVSIHQEKTCEKFIPYGMSSYPVQKWYNFIPSNCHFIPN
jgi:hypothetical protein